MNGLDLFSGIGGISLALRPWVKTVAYCEIDSYCQAVLLERMLSGDLDIAPIWTDARTFGREQFELLEKIDIISAGFPCQDISVAGNQRGISEDTRSGLFFEVIRIAKQCQPTFIFLENVSGIFNNGLREVLREITQMGFDAKWCCLSAEDVGARHKRERWFCLAYRRQHSGEQITDSECDGSFGFKVERGVEKEIFGSKERKDWIGQFTRSGTSRVLSSESFFREDVLRGCEEAWKTESRIPRNAHGIPYQVERIKALGNAVVPQVAREAFRRLMFER